MSNSGSTIDAVGKVEQNNLTPIPLSERHGDPKDLFAMWAGSNINYVVLLNGVLLITLGLGLSQSLFAIIIGNLLGCTILGLASLPGPKSGSSMILTSRTSFGQLAAYLPIFISTISVLGWFSINSVVSTEALENIFVRTGVKDSHILMWICLFLVLIGEIALAIYGHATILKTEQWLAAGLGIIFIIFFLFMLPHMDWSYAGTLKSGTVVSTWLIGLGIIFSYPLSWTNFASDYSRYFKPDSDPKKVAFFAGSGQFAALVVCEVIGVVFAIAAKTALGKIASDPVSQVGQLLPTWFVFFFLIAVVIGGMATNVPNGYTAGLSLLALRLPLTRVQGVLVIAVFTLAFRIFTMFYQQFYTLYSNWLSYIIFWTCPWVAIIIVDYFLRKGHYNTIELFKWGKGGAYWYNGGVLWSGLLSFLVGILFSFIFMNSSLFVSPLTTRYLGGADLSYFAGLLVSGLMFYFLARTNGTYREAKEMKSSVLPAE
ncbi:MAG: cytosine permease [Sporolactobacillus sp.]